MIPQPPRLYAGRTPRCTTFRDAAVRGQSDFQPGLQCDHLGTGRQEQRSAEPKAPRRHRVGGRQARRGQPARPPTQGSNRPPSSMFSTLINR